MTKKNKGKEQHLWNRGKLFSWPSWASKIHLIAVCNCNIDLMDGFRGSVSGGSSGAWEPLYFSMSSKWNHSIFGKELITCAILWTLKGLGTTQIELLPELLGLLNNFLKLKFLHRRRIMFHVIFMDTYNYCKITKLNTKKRLSYQQSTSKISN